jgi:hypothetical protein
MKRIISIILIGMMTVGCGKTARLERLERERAEIAAGQARINELSRQKGRLERFSTHVYNNAWTYLFSATTVVAFGSGASFLYQV